MRASILTNSELSGLFGGFSFLQPVSFLQSVNFFTVSQSLQGLQCFAVSQSFLDAGYHLELIINNSKLAERFEMRLQEVGLSGACLDCSK